MADVDIQGPFDGTVTFMRVPFSRDLTRSKAAILGQSYLVRPYEPPPRCRSAR
jgi:hypothetical protein